MRTIIKITEVFNMNEQISKLKDYVEENKEDIQVMSLIAGLMITSFMAGKVSARQDVVLRASYTDKEGNLIKEVYRRVIK